MQKIQKNKRKNFFKLIGIFLLFLGTIFILLNSFELTGQVTEKIISKNFSKDYLLKTAIIFIFGGFILIGGIEKLIHYTSHKKYDAIKESGKLEARSGPYASFGSEIKINDDIKKITSGNEYLVGIPEGEEKGWEKYGLKDLLDSQTSNEVRLKVPIKGQGFVRDHKYISKKYFDKNFKRGFWEDFWKGEIPNNDPRIIEAVQKYVNSAITIDRYDGQYEVPEVWLNQNTAFKDLEKY